MTLNCALVAHRFYYYYTVACIVVRSPKIDLAVHDDRRPTGEAGATLSSPEALPLSLFTANLFEHWPCQQLLRRQPTARASPATNASGCTRTPADNHHDNHTAASLLLDESSTGRHIFREFSRPVRDSSKTNHFYHELGKFHDTSTRHPQHVHDTSESKHGLTRDRPLWLQSLGQRECRTHQESARTKRVLWHTYAS